MDAEQHAAIVAGARALRTDLRTLRRAPQCPESAPPRRGLTSPYPYTDERG